MNCPNCNTPLKPDDLFCGECGQKITQPSPQIHPQGLEHAPSEPALTKSPKPKKKGLPCLIVLVILLILMICIVLAVLLWDEIIYQQRPDALGYLLYVKKGLI